MLQFDGVDVTRYITEYRLEHIRRRPVSVETLDGLRHTRHAAIANRLTIKLGGVPSGIAGNLGRAVAAAAVPCRYPGKNGVTVSETVAVDSYAPRISYVSGGSPVWEIELVVEGGVAG